jgi:hypothetical protein
MDERAWVRIADEPAIIQLPYNYRSCWNQTVDGGCGSVGRRPALVGHCVNTDERNGPRRCPAELARPTLRATATRGLLNQLGHTP